MKVSIPYSLFVYQRELKMRKTFINSPLNGSHAKLQLTQCLVQQNISEISYSDLKCCFMRSIDYKMKLEKQCKQREFKVKKCVEKQSKDVKRRNDLHKITKAFRKINLNIYNFQFQGLSFLTCPLFVIILINTLYTMFTVFS